MRNGLVGFAAEKLAQMKNRSEVKKNEGTP